MLTRRPYEAAGPALDILDTVLDVAKREMLARHPRVDELIEPGGPYGSLDLVARLLVGRLDELRDIADAYRRVLHDPDDGFF